MVAVLVGRAELDKDAMRGAAGLDGMDGNEPSAWAEEDRNRRIDIIYIMLQNNPLTSQEYLVTSTQ